jgi:hypothetical protein
MKCEKIIQVLLAQLQNDSNFNRDQLYGGIGETALLVLVSHDCIFHLSAKLWTV